MTTDNFLSNVGDYKSDFVFLNKSYAKDLDWSLVLYRSYERYVQGWFDFYIVVPHDDVALFQDCFNVLLESEKIRRIPIILSEEYIFSAAKISAEDINKMSGWEVQQVIKLAFSHTNLAKNYVTIDSAAIFARNFDPTTVWLDKAGTPKTFAIGISRQAREEQYLRANEQGWLKGQLASLPMVFDEIDSIMGSCSHDTHVYTGFGCLSSGAIYRMMDYLRNKGFANISEMIKYAPYEYTWYGAFIYSQDPMEFIPMGWVFSPIISTEDLQYIDSLHLNQSPFYGFLFQPPVANHYSAAELEKIVSDRNVSFHAGDSFLNTVVGKLHIHTSGSEGFLVYGPYTELDAGFYRIAIFGQGVHWTGREWFDVVCHYNQERHELLRVNFAMQEQGSWRADHLIKIDAPCTNFEVRVWVAADSIISIEGIEIKRSVAAYT